MRMDRKSWNSTNVGNSRWDADNEPNPADVVGAIAAVGVLGFLFAVSMYGVALWGVCEILYKQGVVGWRLEPWQPYLLSLIYFVARSMNRVMYPKR